MVTRRSSVVGLTAMLTLLVVIVAWTWLGSDPARAASSSVRYVAPGGNCGGATPCYSTVQAAVDAAQVGDEIRIAAGTYSDINNQGGNPQVVYVAKSLTLRGGFTISNWNTPNPDTNITGINAMTLGRVIYVTGVSTTLTLQGLQLTYGDSSGLGGHQIPGFNRDAGGGVFIDQASVTIDQCVIGHNFSPSDGVGGGLYQRNGSLGMTDTIIEENEAGSGGGAYLYKAQSQIGSNSIFRLNDGSAIQVAEGNFALVDSQLVDNEDGGVVTYKTQVVIASTVISGTINGSGIGTSGGGSGGSISYNTIRANEHAGLSIADGDFDVVGNEIAYNRGKGYGDDPGVVIKPVWGGDVTLRNNHIHHNRNTYSACNGAGLYIDTGPGGLVTLASNLIEDNFAGEDAVIKSHGYGGGVYLKGDNILLDGNIIRNNTAFGFIHAGNQYWGGYGGGVYINDSPTLQNNIIADNVVIGGDNTHFHGPGIFVNGGSPELIHNTIVQNHGGDGVGLYASQDSSTSERSQVQMFNTIVVSHTVGIYAPGEVAENIVVADGILWSGNISNTWGTGTFFINHPYTGDPLFVNPAGGDYHISPGSAAIDQGVITSVTNDIDGEPRFGTPDLGADEYWAPGALKRVYLPLVLRQ